MPDSQRHTRPQVGTLLRDWRRRRRMSQLDLACEADISARHLSFIETGRAQPSRDMLLRLAKQLDMPLRQRNALFIAAGYAPVFEERALDDAALKPARAAIDLVLTGHEPYPALAVDRHWTLVAANTAVGHLLDGVDATLLAPPVNVLRLSLHPQGLAPRIVNYHEWRAHLLARLRQQIHVTADGVLAALYDELNAYPAPAHAATNESTGHHDYAGVVVPLRLQSGTDVLSFFSTTTVFGTPVEVTLSELALESFFPADAHTAGILSTSAQ